MKYQLSNPTEVKAARNRISYLVRRKDMVEIKAISPNRTLSQNSYLHLIIGAFGEHFGYTIEEAKQIYKELNKPIYIYRKKDRVFFRSSADLSKEDMAKTIDVFRQKSSEQGYDLPLATDKEWLLQIDNLIEQNRRYL